MFKAALIGTLIATSLSVASPAKADGARFGIHFSQSHNGPAMGVHFRRHRNWISPRQIRRKVRRFGCYNISPVRRIHRRYKVRATCDDGVRVKMIFSVRTGRLLRERVIGYERRRWRSYNWRG